MIRHFKQWLLRKEVRDMAVIYATLITRGAKEYKQVPSLIKDEVAQVLRDLDAAYLIKE